MNINKDTKIIISAVVILLFCCVVFTSAGDMSDVTGQSFLSKFKFWGRTPTRTIREPVSATCYDSDGDNPNKLGYVKLGNKKELDFCSTSGRKERDESRFKVSDCSGTNCYVAEYVCSNNRIAYKKVRCVNGCENGACSATIPPAPVPPTDKCYDSDGLNLGVMGYVKKGNLKFTDACLDEKRLEEAFCMNNNPEEVVFTCPGTYVCKNGACVPKTSDKYCGDGTCTYDEKKLYVGMVMYDPMTNRKVVLENVGSSGAIAVSVDGTMETISKGGWEEVVAGVSVKNINSYYTDAKSERYATLRVGEIYEWCSQDCKLAGDYLTAVIEYRDAVDFSNVEIPAPYGITLGSSEKTIQISSIGIDALSFVDNPLLKTNRVWLVKEGIDLLVFYHDPNLLPNIRFADDIDLGEVKSLLNLREGSNIKISPYSNTVNLYFTKENAQMGMFFGVKNDEINSLGYTQSLAESSELKYSNLDTGFGEHIGTHEGSYIVVTNKGPIVVKDPKTNGASDQVVMDVQI